MQKKYIITGAREIHKQDNYSQQSIELVAMGGEQMDVSDGYHTMDELYTHRIELWITMCRISAQFRHHFKDTATSQKAGVFQIWRSKLHDDGSEFDGWFILGMGKDAGEQITYHLPMSYWERTEFAETLEKAPDWDHHTSADVLERLKLL